MVNKATNKDQTLYSIYQYILRQFPYSKKAGGKVVELLDYVITDHFVFGYIAKFIDISLSVYVRENKMTDKIRHGFI